jgi:hypothetical protein
MLGSDQPWRANAGVYKKAFELEGPRKDLAFLGILTPEALLARRMASQNTAFAIANPGPFQGDDTPILEYTAPRAFYIHLRDPGVSRIMSFDERTWQMDLAPMDATRELATLEPPALKAIFTNGGSVNGSLLDFLKNRYAHYIGRADLMPIMVEGRPLPCIMQGTNRNIPIPSPPSAETNMLVRQLVLSEYTLRAAPANQLAAVENIEGALDSITEYHQRGADWSPAYYADLAVKACLRMANPGRARAILLRGLQLEPDSDQLHYLSRILVRENILQPADLPQTAMKWPH